jgi:hypothetical protein
MESVYTKAQPGRRVLELPTIKAAIEEVWQHFG